MYKTKKHIKFGLGLTLFGLLIAGCSSGPTMYEVTFDTHGGSSVAAQKIEKENKIIKPDDPTRNGYTFINWTYQGEEWSFIDYVVTNNMTLDANWNLNTYSITYNLNGGTNASSNPTTYTVEDTIPLANPSKTEHTFTGWTLNDEPISTIQKGTYGDLTLVANWSINSYNVSVASSDESKGTVSGSGSYEYGSEVTVVATPASECVFKGWYSDSELTNKVSDESSYTFAMGSEDISLYAKFWTQAEEKEAWDKTHGVTPVVDTDNNQVTYGLYPQTVVDDETLILSLNALTTPESNGWYLYEGEYYAKVTAKPYSSSYKFDNGNTIVSGTTYWFLCEAITWDILSSSDGQYYLLSDVLLDPHRYDDSSNNYANSEIRAWLNDDFYNAAFALDNDNIQTTTVDNSASTTNSSSNPFACVDTQDKIFLPSYQDYLNSSYGFSTSTGYSSTRVCKTTDYARARGAYYNTFNGWYWTRSPHTDNSYYALFVNNNGGLTNYLVHYKDYCVRPSLSLLIS